ncbi:MAG: hypothetical protein RID91_06225 [Azospirillaceae bacterium]
MPKRLRARTPALALLVAAALGVAAPPAAASETAPPYALRFAAGSARLTTDAATPAGLANLLTLNRLARSLERYRARGLAFTLGLLGPDGHRAARRAAVAELVEAMTEGRPPVTWAPAGPAPDGTREALAIVTLAVRRTEAGSAACPVEPVLADPALPPTRAAMPVAVPLAPGRWTVPGEAMLALEPPATPSLPIWAFLETPAGIAPVSRDRFPVAPGSRLHLVAAAAAPPGEPAALRHWLARVRGPRGEAVAKAFEDEVGVLDESALTLGEPPRYCLLVFE